MQETLMIGDIPITQLKQDYIRIENAAQYRETIRQINPLDEAERLSYWRGIKKKVIEGMWGKESGGYRFCPGSLYFYTNFGWIQDTDEAKNTYSIRPLIQDIEWEIHYYLTRAEGFSGFYLDDEYTSDELVHTYDINKLPETKREFQLFNSKGELKKYMDPDTNIRRLHEFPKGPALFFNEAKNAMIFGSRGGGKSYTAALGKTLQLIVADGATFYNDGYAYTFADYEEPMAVKPVITPDGKMPKQLLVEVVLGSGNADKSSELFNKIEAGMNALATQAEFGVWGTLGDPDYRPCPLFKDMAGSIKPNNKDNPWRHEYKVLEGGKEIKEGSKSKVYHVTYSENKAKGKGAQAGAGGRTKYAITEEVGLTTLVIEAYNSNRSIVARNGVQFGVQLFIGTSGNIDAVKPSQKMFLNPKDYQIASVPDVWEEQGQDGQIGFFLPFYMTLRRFKDEDGNTDYKKVFEWVYRVRKEAAQSSDPSVLRIEKMNRPIVPSEMWITQKGHYLPHYEASNRERELIKDNHYLELAQPIRLTWNSKYPNSIKHEVNHGAEPFYHFPLDTENMESFDSSIVMYDPPQYGKPDDFYFMTHDPYVSDNIDDGGSFGASHVFINSKYWEDYMPATGPLVATWIAKPTHGLKAYYKEQEKLMAFYNNPVRGLAYEANRGDTCKNYYQQRGKTGLLVLRPTVFDQSSVYRKRVTQYGYMINEKRPETLDRLSDYLMLDVPHLNKKVIETLPCLFTIKQIVQHEIKGNYDAVSSIALAPVHQGVLETEYENEAQDRRRKNELAFFSKNKFLFNEN
jgi:hypothetical protein